MLSGGAETGDILELQGLMSSRPVDRKCGSMSGRVSKQLIYGDKHMPETPFGTGRIREAMTDFVTPQKEGREYTKKNYKRRKTEIKDVVQDLRILDKSISQSKDTDDLGDGEFYGFRGDFAQNKDRRQKEIDVVIASRKEVIGTVG